MSDTALSDTQSAACWKCGSGMEEGFFLEKADRGLGSSSPTEWVQGEPIRSFWHGVKSDLRRKVISYRCTVCGYLESYAIELSE